jgi:predicted nucleic acid-binding protein
VYDAVFAALAEELSALYVTADMRFVRRVSDLAYVKPLAGFTLS